MYGIHMEWIIVKNISKLGIRDMVVVTAVLRVAVTKTVELDYNCIDFADAEHFCTYPTNIFYMIGCLGELGGSLPAD